MQLPLGHVYWLGGGSGAGKSTVARHLAARYGLQLYNTDDAMASHAERSTPDDCPYLHKFMRMDMDERWLLRTPQQMFETFHWFRGEGFHYILEDILSLPREPSILVEGFRLLPALVKPLLPERRRAVWLLPTSEFRQAVFEGRGGVQWAFIQMTSVPERALENLVERDELFTKFLCDETRRLDLHSIKVSAALSEEALTDRVATVLGF